MKFARVCGYDMWVPDSIAEWDAVAGNSPWEKLRMDSILEHLGGGDTLYDIGAEHGWMSAIFARRVGTGSMVLVEPSPEFWPNIRMTFEHNFGHAVPLAAVQAFAGDEVGGAPAIFVGGWPYASGGPECGAMAYRHLNHHRDTIPTVTIDHLARVLGHPPKGITIDVEGAEYGVLVGAEETLRIHRPYVWVSVHPDLCLRDFGYDAEVISDFMDGLGYTGELLHVDHETHMFFKP